MRKLKVIHLGTGPRAINFFLPILAQLSGQVELQAIYGRSREKVEPLARQYHVPGYTDLEQMLDHHPADMATAIVNCSANYAVAEPLARRGISCILETPIELDLGKAHALLELAARHKVRIEIAENSFRFPDERLARKLLDAGLFGRVLVAYNDMGTHGYHAINRLRNYVGFADPIKRVTAFHQTWAGGAGQDRSSGTRMSFIEFASTAVGVHSIGYGLAVNPWPVHKKFVAERGWLACREGEYLDGSTKRAIHIERVGRALTGPAGKSVDVCQEMVADLGGGKQIVWINPLADRAFDDEHLSAAAVVQSMARAVRENVAPEYALQDALIDYETDSAMCCSHANARRVTLPLDLATVAEERKRGLY
jgi:predicted dehydrogenase